MTLSILCNALAKAGALRNYILIDNDMAKLYYLETRKNCVNKVLEVLRNHGLNTDWVKAEYTERHRMIDGELIMWCDNDKYPTHVHLAQHDIIKACGIKVEY